jgi:hypothetical protein
MSMAEYYAEKRKEDAFIREFQKTKEWRDMSDKLIEKVKANEMNGVEFMRAMGDFQREKYEESKPWKRMSVKKTPKKSKKMVKSSKRSARISALRNLPLSMRRSCGEGQVYRKRYARKSHVRKSGVRVKRSIVKGKCIKRASPQTKKSVMRKSVRKVKKF